MGMMDRLKRSFDIFIRGEPDLPSRDMIESVTSTIQGVWRDSKSKVLAPILTRISIDAASVPIRHVMVDENRNFVSLRNGTEIDDRLFLRANIDQTGPDLIRDAVITMLTYGSCVFVAVESEYKPTFSSGVVPLQVRVGYVTNWYNRSVKISLYNEHYGEPRELTLSKHEVAICYNPLYGTMNEPNSTLNRLIDKLALLDVTDQRASMPGLDILLQFPYAVKGAVQEAEAKRRVQILENQMFDSRYGIAYVDGTEKVHQLNRPVENRLQEQVANLTNALHSQLGLSEAVFNGTAGEAEMLLYYQITRDPILLAITNALSTTWLSRTAIKQGQWILPIPRIFKMAPLSVLADAADKLTTAEIVNSNEVRQAIGLPPVDSPNANELRNKHLNETSEEGGSIDELPNSDPG